LVSAKLLSATEIGLVFSEAVADPSAVDPEAFHLSAGLAFKAGTQVGFISYYSFSYSGYPPVTFCVPGYGIYSSASCPNGYCLFEPRLHRDHTAYFGIDSIDALAPGDQPNAIVATLAKPILDAPVYGFLTKGHTGPCGDLFLHYTEPSGAGVESTHGEALRSVGESFGACVSTLCSFPNHAVPVSRHLLDQYCNATSTCGDGFTDEQETDVDCGGPTCPLCELGKRCAASTDCANKNCVDGICQAPTCTDGVLNGGEEDIDCGGTSACPRCENGKSCQSGTDCQSGMCLQEWDPTSYASLAGVCHDPSCSDGRLDGSEMGIDCGGNCPRCVGDACSADADCASSNCVASQCATPSITAISTGGCALSATNQLYCWGDGEADLFTTVPMPAEQLGATIESVSVYASPSDGHNACAITTAGAVTCWGNDDRGQLGDGQGLSYWKSAVFVVGLDARATAVSTSGRHACALTTLGAVFCWGDNDLGQLGQGTTQTEITAVPVIGLGSGIRAIATSEQSGCALTTQGRVKCWGAMSGDGTAGGRVTPVDVVGLTGIVAISGGGSHVCALKSDGSVLCWGGNASGELGDGTQTQRLEPVDVHGLGAPVVAITAGHRHTCAVTNVGAAFCWGDNLYGELGDGTETRRLTPEPVVWLDSGVAAISAGTYTTCAVTTAGKVYCWGQNTTGALGAGDTTPRNTPTEVVGL
jgi:hypothetical protein